MHQRALAIHHPDAPAIARLASFRLFLRHGVFRLSTFRVAVRFPGLRCRGLINARCSQARIASSGHRSLTLVVSFCFRHSLFAIRYSSSWSASMPSLADDIVSPGGFNRRPSMLAVSSSLLAWSVGSRNESLRHSRSLARIQPARSGSAGESASFHNPHRRARGE